jgi:pilus assembly protein Flp/PilA
MKNLLRLLRSTRAATAVEYGLIVALIFLAALVGIQNFGTGANKMWNGVANNSLNNL